MVDDPQQIGRYLRCKRAWVVIDRRGVIRFLKTAAPGAAEPSPNNELLRLLQELR